MEELFLGKLNDDDRDSVLYVSFNESGDSVHGPAFSRSFDQYDVDNMKYSLLTKEELESILDNGITDYIIDILSSEENETYYNEYVLPEEIDKLKRLHRLNDDEIKMVFDYNPTDFKDSSIVINVYDDVEEFGYEKAWSYGWSEDGEASSSCPEHLILHNHQFDYDQFIDDLLDNEDVLELPDGRILYYMI